MGLIRALQRVADQFATTTHKHADATSQFSSAVDRFTAAADRITTTPTTPPAPFPPVEHRTPTPLRITAAQIDDLARDPNRMTLAEMRACLSATDAAEKGARKFVDDVRKLGQRNNDDGGGEAQEEPDEGPDTPPCDSGLDDGKAGPDGRCVTCGR